MSALSSQLLWSDFLIVQVIFDLHINRKIFITCSLIINITAVCVPCNLVSVLGKCLITFYVLNVIKIGYVRHLTLSRSGILQPVRYCDILYITFCCGIYIYCFFLGYRIISFLCCCQYRSSSKNCRHSGSHCNIQNFFISIHLTQLLIFIGLISFVI